jgi:hypothetical protein
LYGFATPIGQSPDVSAQIFNQDEASCPWRGSSANSLHRREQRMRFLGFAYRFITNFAFLASVYLSLNYIEKYNSRAILAIIVLIYAGMRSTSAVRSFYFFQRIERLEVEARRVIALFTEGGAQSPLKRQTVAEVSMLRRDGEIKSYIELFFLACVVLLCVAKIVTS